ncbi:uncharacterized protein LOC130635740 [Hydractinia symbiolongicarpus]|uniref:uncharacterized protein LOC130635740 n=1 Tax=Hydractinia symbiolongicarpus TaxID=13093 RepID=UPI00254EEFDC|nr:uncharacterized protein LOC130635740 [Hydractinia symbiolongicarpus]
MYNFIQEMKKMVFMLMLASACFATQLKVGGTNVCRRSVSYSTYKYQIIYKVVYRSYRTRGAWWKRKTAYRSESKSSQELEVITNYKSVYTCCRGWSKKNDHCPIPICATGCRNGNCTAPDRCTCHEGYHGYKCQHASSGKVTVVKNVFERVQIKSTVVMEWKIAHSDNQTNKVLKLYVLPDRDRPVFSSYGKYQSSQGKGRQTFGNRLSATFSKIKGKYTVTLKRIQYNENYTFQLKVIFINKKSVTETKVADIRIKNVVGMLFCYMVYRWSIGGL